MKTTTRRWEIVKTLLKSFQIGSAGFFLLYSIGARADVSLGISTQCPDVTLSWQSVPGETFTVYHRADLNPNNSWTALAELFPAALGGTATVFVHNGGMIVSGKGATWLRRGGGCDRRQGYESNLVFDPNTPTSDWLGATTPIAS